MENYGKEGHKVKTEGKKIQEDDISWGSKKPACSFHNSVSDEVKN